MLVCALKGSIHDCCLRIYIIDPAYPFHLAIVKLLQHTLLQPIAVLHQCMLVIKIRVLYAVYCLCAILQKKKNI